MRLIDDLRRDHELIEQVLGSLRTFVLDAAGDPADGPRFLRFFQDFAAWHHAREEDVLFPALVDRVGLPGDRGPVHALRLDHADMAGVLAQLGEALLALPSGPAARAQAQERAVRYSRALWSHIDAENSVLLPEAERRLRQASVGELPDPEPTEAQRQAEQDGTALVRRYPPTEDREALRGDGCIACPSFGERCRGVELEWWNEHEWEEFGDHLG